MSTPAPASLYVPRSKRLPPVKRAERATVVEAPASPHQVDIELLLARVTIRGVAGVSSIAVAEYVAILQRDLANAARLARLAAPTLPAPASIDATLLDAVEDEQPEKHDRECRCPECDPGWNEHYPDDALFVSEADAVLSDSAGYYGVSSGGAW